MKDFLHPNYWKYLRNVFHHMSDFYYPEKCFNTDYRFLVFPVTRCCGAVFVSTLSERTPRQEHAEVCSSCLMDQPRQAWKCTSPLDNKGLQDLVWQEADEKRRGSQEAGSLSCCLIQLTCYQLLLSSSQWHIHTSNTSLKAGRRSDDLKLQPEKTLKIWTGNKLNGKQMFGIRPTWSILTLFPVFLLSVLLLSLFNTSTPLFSCFTHPFLHLYSSFPPLFSRLSVLLSPQQGYLSLVPDDRAQVFVHWFPVWFHSPRSTQTHKSHLSSVKPSALPVCQWQLQDQLTALTSDPKPHSLKSQ